MNEIYFTLNLRGNDYGKNILESTVIRSTTIPVNVKNIYYIKFLILIDRSKDWLMIG